MLTILAGDCRDTLKTLPAESVHCCVTSPPYFGLRDYGCDGQMGLEATPEQFIAGMVGVFRDVRRVLRDDGTLWLNIGDSYCSTDKWGGGKSGNTGKQTVAKNGEVPSWACRSKRSTIDGVKPKDLMGIPWMLAFALRAPYVDWQIASEAMRAWVAGIVDGEGCITILRTKSSHSESLSFPPIVQVRMCDLEPLHRLVAVAGSSFGAPQMPPSHLASKQREGYQWKVVSDKAAKVIAEIYPYLTCKRKQAVVAWNHQMFRAARGNQARATGDIEKEQFCKELINKLNQRQMVDLPSWMLEPKVVETPGWYLRQDCIWSKPNPMAESVTDRCTKAHEYLFLLSKSPRYYFNAEAIAEEATCNSLRTKMPDGWDTGAGAHGAFHRKGRERGAVKRAKDLNLLAIPANGKPHSLSAFEDRNDRTYASRNKRSVWTVATQPFSEAHFATFPPALIRPCIRAGCPVGGTVIDPFLGSGTTGMVAIEEGRNAIGCELNPEYIEIAKRRCNITPGFQFAAA